MLEINKYCSISEGNIVDNFINSIHTEIRYLLVEGYQVKELLKENSMLDEEENDSVDPM